MAIQRAVRLHQWQEKKKQLDLSITCSHSVALGCAACTEVHCGSGSCFVCLFCLFFKQKGESVRGQHAQPSQWRSLKKKKWSPKSIKN